MRQIFVATMILGSLAACGSDGYGGGAEMTQAGDYPAVGAPISPSADATLSLSVTNDDGVDYALWIQWQDGTGSLNQDFVALLPAASPGGVSTVCQGIPVLSGLPYTLLLLDPSGTPWDSWSLGALNPGDVLPMNLTVLNAAFLTS